MRTHSLLTAFAAAILIQTTVVSYLSCLTCSYCNLFLPSRRNAFKTKSIHLIQSKSQNSCSGLEDASLSTFPLSIYASSPTILLQFIIATRTFFLNYYFLKYAYLRTFALAVLSSWNVLLQLAMRLALPPPSDICSNVTFRVISSLPRAIAYGCVSG